MHQPRRGGWIEIICGCMFSGKTEELIRRVKRAQIARQKVQVFQHCLDLRYGERRVASHAGAQLKAATARTAAELRQQIERAPQGMATQVVATQVVAIDEAQFFDAAIAPMCEELADRGLRVIVAGLDMDFRGEPFGAMPRLLTVAEMVDKLNAICVVCGAPATRTQRLIDGQPAYYEDPIIMVGASEVYEARCRACHQVPRRE